MKKLMAAVTLLLMSTSSFAALYSSTDAKNKCTLYRVVNASTEPQAQPNETLELHKEIYGLSFFDLKVDFDNREAKVKIIVKVAMGFNRPLIPNAAIIPADNKNFTGLVNQVNRQMNLVQKLCINKYDEIVYSDLE